MCFYDAETPTHFVEERITKARKPHKCCECRGSILPGESYYKAIGVWDGEFSSYKRCNDCDILCGEILKIELSHGCAQEEASVPFGELPYCIRDYGLELTKKSPAAED